MSRRPVWLAANTTYAECAEAVVPAHQGLTKAKAQTLTLIALKKTSEVKQLLALLRGLGLKAALWSKWCQVRLFFYSGTSGPLLNIKPQQTTVLLLAADKLPQMKPTCLDSLTLPLPTVRIMLFRAQTWYPLRWSSCR